MTELRWLQAEPHDEPVLLSLLDETERVRAARFHHAADRLAYAAAHALLRAMLSEMAGGAPTDWRFVRAPSGKPRLDKTQPGSDLRFNLSHTRGLVACAVANGVEVGVDVEPITTIRDALKLAGAYFSRHEADGLGRLAEPARSEAFLRLWTLKEAAHKAAGTGLQARLDVPGFEPRHVADCEHPSPLHPSEWAFQCFRPTAGFALSLAWPDGQGPASVRLRRAEVRAGRVQASA